MARQPAAIRHMILLLLSFLSYIPLRYQVDTMQLRARSWGTGDEVLEMYRKRPPGSRPQLRRLFLVLRGRTGVRPVNMAADI